MNIGSASILLVFVILCLVSFAVLSIVSANADSRLSTRVLEPTMMPAIRQSSLWPVWTIRCVASTKPPTARMRITAP